MKAIETDFTKGSIPRAITRIAIPMTIAQLVNLLYNIVDRMYIGHMPVEGQDALTGLGLVLPIISIIIAFANLCGTGGAPLCSICRGKGENDEAERVLGNSFTLLVLFGVALTAVILIFKEPILYLFGASPVTFPYADDYLTIYTVGTVFVMIGLGMNPFINSQGFAKVGMLTVALGAAVNIVLDPIFIFALDMGVRGAALATVISQGCSAVWVLLFLTGRRGVLRLRWENLRLHRARVGRILGLGTSGFVMAMTNSLVQILCNATLQTYGGDLYVGVMTVINSVREVVSLPVSGLPMGCQPVLGYNYGAKQYERVRQGIRFTTIITFGYATVMWLIVMAVPGVFIHLFNSETALLQAGVPAFRLYFALFFFMSLQNIGQSIFVALGKSKQAIFFSLLRKAFIVAPLTLLLPAMGLGYNGVFLAEPISNVLGGLACIITMYFTVYRPLAHISENGYNSNYNKQK